MRKLAYSTAVVLAATSLLTACGNDDMMSDAGHAGGMADGDSGHMDNEENSPVADDARRIEVAATSFAFDPEDLEVDTGEDIAVVLTSDDVEHDFTIDELDAHVVAGADESAEGGFTATEPGRYTFYCSVAGHREAGMEGTLTVS